MDSSFNEEQLQFIKDNDFYYRKLYGVPGGGKTKCIIEKIVYLKESGIIQSPQDFLVLTFSRQACEDFIVKAKKRDSKLFSSKNIRTIHSSCSSLLYHYKSETSMNITTIVYECLQELEKRGNEFTNTYWEQKKVIFVDEAQDISELQYKWILKLGKLYDCPMIMIGDPNQNIFQFQNGTDKFLLEHPGEAVTLRYNYRSSSEIVAILNHFRPWNTDIEILSHHGVHKKKPLLVIDTLENILAHILTSLIRSNYELHEMAIIAPIKLSHTNCISLSVIANFLSQYDIPFIKHYQDSDRDQNYKKVRELCPGKVNLLTIHAAKGLEFKKIFLCNFHFHTKVSIPTKEEFLENKYLWYVGLSRAMKELQIYALKDTILFPTIYTCPPEIYIHKGELIETPYTFRKKIADRNILHSIKNFITTKTILDEDKLYELHQLFEYTLQIQELYHVNVQLYEYEHDSILYGLFMDDWMFFKTVPVFHYIQYKKRWFEMKVPLPKDLWFHSLVMKKKHHKAIHYFEDFMKIMKPECPKDRAIYKILKDTLQEEKNIYFEFCLDNHVCEFNKNMYDDLLHRLEFVVNLEEKVKLVWEIVLFQYQLDYECKYLLQKDFSNHLVTILPYVEQIEKLHYFNSNTLFQIPIADPDLQLKGIMDALDDKNRIYEFKFCQEITLHSYLQLFLYALIHYTNLEGKQVELWNLQTGKRYLFQFTKNNAGEIKDYIKRLFR